MEKHPQILHLPAPHIWQITPTQEGSSNGLVTFVPLVVTLELHVKEELADADVLELSRWAWEKCMSSLSGSRSIKTRDRNVEVTVGIVRG